MARGSVTIKINGLEELKGKLAQYGEKVKENTSRACADAAYSIERLSKLNLTDNKSVITKSLVNSFIVLGKEGDLNWSVGTNILYGPDVEYGTAAHEITPKTAKCLAFEIDGKMVFVKRVHHPGTKAKPYFNPAVEETRPIYQEQLKEALKGD